MRMISTPYTSLFCALLAIGWLLPNNLYPWTSFHMDAWVALVLLVVVLIVVLYSPEKIEVPGLALLFLLLSGVPWIQHFLGVIYSSGNAWINFLYLSGFAMAITVGYQWHKNAPGQALCFLFSAFLIAGMVSVVIEILQIAKYSSPWVVEFVGFRAHANLRQPNQLGSLLVLALLGVAWWYQKKTINSVVAVGFALFLLFGIALTLSRTAWVNLGVVAIGLVFFWKEKTWQKLFYSMMLMLVFFVLITIYVVPEFVSYFSETIRPSSREFSDPVRIAIWRSALEAIASRPWLGWGWGQFNTAIIESSPDMLNGKLITATKQAHNILLDLLVYNGVVIASVVVIFVSRFMVRSVKPCLEQNLVIPLLGVSTLMVHSMLELPLHYAYFLLPFGVLLGVVAAVSATKSAFFSLPKKYFMLLYVGIFSAFFITVRDYFEVEKTFYDIGYATTAKLTFPTPSLTVLKQWEDRLWFANSPPTEIKDESERKRIISVLRTAPQSLLELKYAHHLVLGGEQAMALNWLESICKTAHPLSLAKLQEYWDALTQSNSAFLTAPWPSSCGINR